MKLVHYRVLAASVLIALFTFGQSLALAVSPAAAQKARRGAVKKAPQKKAAKSTPRKKTAKAKSTRSRNSKRVASQRSRRGKRWRGRKAKATPSYTRTGVHDYLTEVWTATKAGRGTPGGPVLEQEHVEEALPDAPEDAEVQPVEAALGGVPLNPIVLGFATSLDARGYSADNQGFIVETLDGEVLAENNADQVFNPASVVKVATSLAAISKLGPDFRFRTSIYTDGTLNPDTGILNGSLYVIGSGDPAFFFENAMLIADKLNRSGIREVSGNLVVLGPLYFNLSASRELAAREFRKTLTPETWTPGAKRAFPIFRSMRAAEESAVEGGRARRAAHNTATPSLKIHGETVTNPGIDTSRLKPLAVHTSLPLVLVLKALNDFSNNWMASVIGNMVGGPIAVQRYLKTDVGLKDDEVKIVTSSGLGTNHISPRATIHILRKLTTYLNSRGLGLEDILPVAGVDAGTLQRRFKDIYRGSVVAKTGTLRGVSALAGIANTRSRGPLLFVIYNRGGSPAAMRTIQDETVKKLITFYGGPAPVKDSRKDGPHISGREGRGGSNTSATPER